MKEYEYFEHTSDVLFRAYGKTLEEAFENAGKALFATMTDIRKIGKKTEYKLDVEADDKEGLLRKWLNELIFTFDAEHILFSGFKVKINKNKITAIGYGEKYDEKRHKIAVCVKAATYHMMEVHEEKNKCWVQAVIDV